MKINAPALCQSAVAPRRETWHFQQTSEQGEAKQTLIENAAG